MSFDYKAYVEKKIGKHIVNSTGQMITSCPFCERPDKFYIDCKSGNYICFVCEQRGRGLVGVVAELEGIPFRQAKEFISNDEGSQAREYTLTEMLAKLRPVEEKKEKFKVDIPLPDGYIPVYDGKKWSYPAYLKKRGISKETAHLYRLGLVNHGYYGGRVVIPIECPNGNSFTARDVTGQHGIRYLNPKVAGHGKLVFGWNQCNFDRHVVLVEGAFDAINLHNYGFQTLALLGKVLHVEQQNMFWALPSSVKFTVMLDAGETASANKVAKVLAEHFDEVKIATLQDGLDPGDATYDQALEAISLSVPFSPIGEIKARLKSIGF